MKTQLTFNWKSKAFLMALLGVFTFSFAQAQSLTVSGTVSDELGPLAGVSVVVKGTANGTTTDFDGNYTIDAETSDVLVFSYIGFATQEIAVDGQTQLNVTMQEDVSALEEVVVIGYGTAKRKDITGSVASVKTEELDQIKPVSFEGGLAARASGVQVTQSQGGPGAGFKVRIRGGTSINASSDPLYVVDGFALPGGASSNSVGLGNSTTSPLATIDPSTIESIEVLKDASATAIYGSRGANGVVIITTKGGKKGRADLTFETFTGVSQLVRPIQLLTGQEYVDYWNEYFPWTPTDPTNQFSRSYRDQFGNALNLTDPRVVLTDWQDEITRTALTQSYQMSITGGSEKTSYSASFSYLNQEGIIKSSDLERYNVNLRVDQDVNDWIKAGASINFGTNLTGGVVSAANENANGRAGIITNSILFSPVQGITRYSDAEYDDDGRLLSLRDGDVTNPSVTLEENINRGKNFQSFGSAYVQFQLAEGLTYKSSVRGRVNSGKNEAYYSESFGWGRTANGRAFVGTNFGTGLITEQNLNYTQTFGDHNLNVTAVYEQQQNTFESNNQASTGFSLPGVNLDNLAAASEHLPNNSNFGRNSLKSYLARVQYGYKGRYTLNASARYDGSSLFSEDRKWGFFPSVGVAWNVANEDFFKDNPVINNLRFKASYGETGNNQIPPNIPFSQAIPSPYILDGSNLLTGAAISKLANEELTWETTVQFDAGVSLSLFNDRIDIEADYYDKDTSDLLLLVPLPPTSGFTAFFQNLGKLNNTGYELAINTVNIETENFSWNTNFNISFNKNEVIDLGEANEFFVSAIGDNQIGNDYVVRVGEPLGSMIGLERDGIYEFDDFAAFDGLSQQQASDKIIADAQAAGIPYYDLEYELKDDRVLSSGQPDRAKYRPGLPKLVDQNGDGIVNDEDRTIIGNSQPDHFGGFTNNLKYKNFDFSVITQWSYGNDIYNKNVNKGSATEIPFFNKYDQVADRWSPSNTDTDIPTIWGYGDAGISGNAYSDFIEDGSYLRISNITLGYTLPSDMTSKFGIKKLRVYGAFDNAYIWTNYRGFDPDVNVGLSQLTPGLDSDAYPRARNFRMGVSIGF